MNHGLQVAFCGLVAIGFALGGQSGVSGRSSYPLGDFSRSIEELARRSRFAVVRLSVKGPSLSLKKDEQRVGFVGGQKSSGSGVIVDSTGYIVTNAHVVSGARSIEVTLLQRGANGLESGTRHTVAKIVGMDRETDLALLKIDGDNLPALSFTDSSEVKQGQLVIALGSPMGLDNSLSVGFISATARQIGSDLSGTYLQTDAPINPGNSGGPLLDIYGRIVGINTMMMSQSGGNEGIGFAIPSSIVSHVYQGLAKDGRIRRGEIGVVPQEITSELALGLDLDRESGVILSDVIPDGSAYAAGLRAGDIVVAADQKPIREPRQLIAAIFQHSAADSLTISIDRRGKVSEFSVAVLERPKSIDDLTELASRDAKVIRRLGILAVTLDEKVTPLLGDLRSMSGVAVAGVLADSGLANLGLLAGDVISEVDGRPIVSVEDLVLALDDTKAGKAVALHVEREGRFLYVAFELE
jgi:serine protease Do